MYPKLGTLALDQGFSTHFRPWTTTPFQITLWTPVDNQKINQTQTSTYTLHLIHSSIYISLRYCRSREVVTLLLVSGKLDKFVEKRKDE